MKETKRPAIWYKNSAGTYDQIERKYNNLFKLNKRKNGLILEQNEIIRSCTGTIRCLQGMIDEYKREAEILRSGYRQHKHGELGEEEWLTREVKKAKSATSRRWRRSPTRG
jgi:hypothetical protein